MTAVAETPQFPNPMLRAVAGGWRLSGLYRYSSGGYLTVTSALDRALTGQPRQRPDQLLLNVYGDKSLSNYLNPAAFAQPGLGTYGNLGVANILAPANWQFDMALSRMFRLGESQKLEVRAEAFNVTNSLRKGNPDLNLNSNTFGQIVNSSDTNLGSLASGVRDPRILQFALKYLF